MLNITKFNNTQKKIFDIDLKKVSTWIKAKDLQGKTVQIVAIGWHKSDKANYGDSVFAVTADNRGINLPSWTKDTVEKILADEPSVEEIKAGKVAIHFSEYRTKGNVSTTNIEFVEVTANATLDTNSMYPSINASDLPY